MEKSKSVIAAEALLSASAVVLRPADPFTWASGIKSPIYCDNRVLLAYPALRTAVEDGLAELIKREYPEAETLMGTATAGIPHAAYVSERLNLPMGYVRGANKDHGKGNRIEGRLVSGDKVVVVEDLISTGGSCIEAVNALKEAGAVVLGVVSIFTYNIKRGFDNFNAAGTEYKALTDLETLLDTAVANGYITAQERESVLSFRNSL